MDMENDDENSNEDHVILECEYIYLMWIKWHEFVSISKDSCM